MMLLLATSLLILASISEGTEPKVVCYYTNWSVYRPELGRYPTSKIEPNLCTHLNYAFGSFTKESELRPSDKYQDIDIDGYITFTGLKSVNPKLKTLFSIGGTAQGSSTFSHVASDPARRATFITNAIKFLRIHNFDGLDVDWTAPGTGRGSRPDDKANYILLLKELSKSIKAEPGNNSPLLLSVTVQRDDGLDFAEINGNVDYMNVRGYDYHSAVDEAVNNHAPLFAPPDDIYNLNATVSYLIKRGADRSKLVIGIPTYGRTFTLTDPKESTIGSPATGPGERGKYTREQGFFAYYEICDNIKNDPGWTVVHPDPNSMGPYAVKGDQWVGYDDVDIVKKKVEYMKEEKLGGVFFWTIDNDDFLGTCHGKSYPLINAAKEALQNN